MEFIDEDTRPRFLLKGRSSPSSPPPPETLTISKLHAAFCLLTATALLVTAFSLPSHAPITCALLTWLSLSLLLAPFAPPSLTGGDPSVGSGHPLPPPAPRSDNPGEPRRRPAARWNPKPALPPINYKSNEEKTADPSVHAEESANNVPDLLPEEWTAEDLEILKRHIAKHPAGAPGRWERVAGAFKGRHAVESVIRMAKSLRPPGDDSFAQFMKQRKVPEKRAVDDVDAHCSVNSAAANGVAWSSGEDIALLNALKVFPKDAPMRWEKVAAAMPGGRPKTECMARVAELKRSFRSSKNAES